jgi:EAP30/Vps36 family
MSPTTSENQRLQSARSLPVNFHLLILYSKDMRKAVESLHKLGSDFKILNTGSKRVICSVSIELSQDNMKILEVAEENLGWITFTKLREKQPMFSQKDRFNRCMD